MKDYNVEIINKNDAIDIILWSCMHVPTILRFLA